MFLIVLTLSLMVQDRKFSLIQEGFGITVFWNKPNRITMSRVTKIDFDGLLLQSDIGMRSEDFLDEVTYLDVIMQQVAIVNQGQLERARKDTTTCQHHIVSIDTIENGTVNKKQLCAHCRVKLQNVVKQRIEIGQN